ncbi:MAG: AI-2E family transporter [Saprospiraceae bacterium]|nr:AI-2E family transporter [Saprospiraceae bacterium]
MGSLAYLLFAQLAELTYEWSDINNKVIEALQNVSVLLADNLGLSADKQSEIIQNIAGNTGNKIFSLLGSAFTGFTDSFVFLLLTPIFSFLILLYRNKLVNTLYYMFPKGKRNAIYKILKETILTYYNFAKGMLLVYLLVGILNSAGLAIIGVPRFIVRIYSRDTYFYSLYRNYGWCPPAGCGGLGDAKFYLVSYSCFVCFWHRTTP